MSTVTRPRITAAGNAPDPNLQIEVKDLVQGRYYRLAQPTTASPDSGPGYIQNQYNKTFRNLHARPHKLVLLHRIRGPVRHPWGHMIPEEYQLAFEIVPDDETGSNATTRRNITRQEFPGYFNFVTGAFSTGPNTLFVETPTLGGKRRKSKGTRKLKRKSRQY